MIVFITTSNILEYQSLILKNGFDLLSNLIVPSSPYPFDNKYMYGKLDRLPS